MERQSVDGMRPTWGMPLRYTIVAAILVLLAALLWYVRALLQPLLAAAVVAYVLSPAASFLKTRFHTSRKVAATIVFCLAIAAVVVIIGTLAPILLEQLQSVQSDLRSAVRD